MPALNEPKSLLIASTNTHKVSEIVAILSTIWTNTQFLSLKDVPHPSEVVEDGETFADNAIIKAKAYGQFASMACIADDSGLCVDILQGAPGIFSARYAGEHAKDADNNNKLMSELSQMGAGPFSAHYMCAIALYSPEVTVHAQGKAHGHIHLQAKGTQGFGYDPYFVPQHASQSMAELSSFEKNSISHRFKALSELVKQLRR